MSFQVHTPDSAPEGAQDILNGAKQKYGFVPNLLGVMSEAPALTKAYATLGGIFDETSFSPSERQVVLLTVSHDNGCEYCVAAHSVIAGMQKVPDEVISAIRDDSPLPDEKLEALRQFTSKVVTSQGWPEEADVKAFLDAGYGKQQILEVVLGIGFKILSNYTNHIADTPLDEAFSQQAWTKAA